MKYSSSVVQDVIAAEEAKQPEQPQDPTKETILQTSRLFVRNLAFSCTDDELRDLFLPFGEINQVRHSLSYSSQSGDARKMTNYIGTSDLREC